MDRWIVPLACACMLPTFWRAFSGDFLGALVSAIFWLFSFMIWRSK